MERKQRLPEDVVEYYIFPLLPESDQKDEILQYLEEQVDLYLAFVSPLVVDYIWQNDPFRLTTVVDGDLPPHLYGRTNFGDNIEDEWFIVYLLFRLTKHFPGVVSRVFDSDEEFLLIEAAEVLPKWINPDTAENRVFIYNGELHIIPVPQSPAEISFLPGGTPSIGDGVNCVRKCEATTRASDAMQDVIKKRINGFPSKLTETVHYAHCYIPANLAAVIDRKPALVAKAVQTFYYRDPVDLRCCRTMQYFRPGTRVISRVKFTRCLYAQLMQQKFTPDKRSGWVLPSKLNPTYKSHDLGMKLSHGFEIMCAKCANNRGQSSTTKQNYVSPYDVRWNRYFNALRNRGYFQGEVEGSMLYNQLLYKAKEFYNSQIQTVNRYKQAAGSEVLDLLDEVKFDIEEMRRNEPSLPPPDDDSWLDLTPEGLENILKSKSGSDMDSGQMSSTNAGVSQDPYDLSTVADSMKSFVDKVSGLEGAEFPGDDEDDDIQFDSTGFIASMQKMFEFEDNDDASSSDMSEYDWDDSDEESRPKHLNLKKHVVKPPRPANPPSVKQQNRSTNHSSVSPDKSNNQPSVREYMDMMDRELAKTDVGKSFTTENQVNESAGNKSKAKTSRNKNIADEDDDFVPVNVDLNVVQNMLQSLGSQEGLPGPASNILNSMGIKLPPDADKLEETNSQVMNDSKTSTSMSSFGDKPSRDNPRSKSSTANGGQPKPVSRSNSRPNNEGQGSSNGQPKPLPRKSSNGQPTPPPRKHRPKPVQRQVSKETSI